MGRYADPTLNFGAFSNAELNTWLTAVKAEIMLRMGVGRVGGGGSTAQNYQMKQLSDEDLIRLSNGLSSALGLDFGDTLRVRPNFNTTGGRLDPYGGEVGISR